MMNRAYRAEGYAVKRVGRVGLDSANARWRGAGKTWTMNPANGLMLYVSAANAQSVIENWFANNREDAKRYSVHWVSVTTTVDQKQLGGE